MALVIVRIRVSVRVRFRDATYNGTVEDKLIIVEFWVRVQVQAHCKVNEII